MHGNLRQGGNALLWILLLVALVAAGAWYWFFMKPQAPDAPEPPPMAITPPAETAPAPLPPVVSPPPPQEATVELPAEQEPPLPSLGESDGVAQEAAEDLFGDAAAQSLLITEGLISKMVAAVDALTLDEIPESIVPVQRPGEAFRVEPAGVSGEINPETGLPEDLYVLSEANFDRYGKQVEVFEAIDIESLVSEYERLYPLLQQSYGELHPDADFNDRLMDVIDHLLAAPEPEYPVQLVKPEAFYEFAEPRLEALSAGQKIMVRIGPSNAARVKAKLAEIREALAQTQRE